MTSNERKKLYTEVVRALDAGGLSRSSLFSRVGERLGLSEEQIGDTSALSAGSKLRAQLGAILEAMEGRGLIYEKDGVIHLSETKPVTVKAFECEREILKMLAGRSMTKYEIRSALEDIIGTGRTATMKDDHVLFSYVGQILKRLVNEGTLTLIDGCYSISQKRQARLGDLGASLELKADFLNRLHRCGGEFFEHYFLALMSKYLSKHGKTVTESYVTGGAADGGIDGVIKTVDCLGFRETVMIQTKNRNSYTPETDVRAFYGAVCAKMGSRGVFATSSDFHDTAKRFLHSIDNCVGVDGTKIFEMATECAYGIKKQGGKYVIDERVL